MPQKRRLTPCPTTTTVCMLSALTPNDVSVTWWTGRQDLAEGLRVALFHRPQSDCGQERERRSRRFAATGDLDPASLKFGPLHSCLLDEQLLLCCLPVCRSHTDEGPRLNHILNDSLSLTLSLSFSMHTHTQGQLKRWL